MRFARFASIESELQATAPGKKAVEPCQPRDLCCQHACQSNFGAYMCHALSRQTSVWENDFETSNLHAVMSHADITHVFRHVIGCSPKGRIVELIYVQKLMTPGLEQQFIRGSATCNTPSPEAWMPRTTLCLIICSKSSATVVVSPRQRLRVKVDAAGNRCASASSLAAVRHTRHLCTTWYAPRAHDTLKPCTVGVCLPS